MFVVASRDVAKRGVLVPGRSSADEARDDGPALVKNPAVQIVRDTQAALHAWVVQLGFSPDARGRANLGALDDDHDEDDPFS
jgi:P27 family predicted phage terminase small subunit